MASKRTAYRIEGFELHEALAALDLCRRMVRVQWIYLNDELERFPLSDHEYSEWKLRDARNDLRRMIKIVRAFRRPHLKLAGES